MPKANSHLSWNNIRRLYMQHRQQTCEVKNGKWNPEHKNLKTNDQTDQISDKDQIKPESIFELYARHCICAKEWFYFLFTCV